MFRLRWRRTGEDGRGGGHVVGGVEATSDLVRGRVRSGVTLGEREAGVVGLRNGGGGKVADDGRLGDGGDTSLGAADSGIVSTNENLK